MKYESPILEITNFDIREMGVSQNPGGEACGVQTPDMDL